MEELYENLSFFLCVFACVFIALAIILLPTQRQAERTPIDRDIELHNDDDDVSRRVMSYNNNEK